MSKQRFEEMDKVNSVQDHIGAEGDQMSFKEIGDHLGITSFEAQRAYDSAMRKLKSPKMARMLWDYAQIGTVAEDVSSSDMGGVAL